MGRAISLAYAREGVKVLVADLNEAGAWETVKAINAQQGEEGKAAPFRIDVRDQSQVGAMIDTAIEHFGGIDILVNNAGVGKIIPFLETTEAGWDFMFDINCKGLLWCSQAAARQMIE